jgi:hypothetical protein
MLTKWGAALGLASAGRIASGGGGNTGVLLGPFANWAALPASAQGGALAFVADLGPTNSYGIARYEAAGPVEWQLLLGWFETLADLNAFTEPKALTAVATVGPSLEAPDSVRYQWDDPNVQWLRTPDPVEYIYAATDWANLPTQDTIQPSDEVAVGSLGYTHSSGRGQRHGNEWRLIEGKFQSVSDMTAFDVANVVHTDAIALVKAGGGHDEESIAYSYQGSAWVRFGATTTAGYAWTLTETQLLTGADPSGIGAVQEGDYGTYTPTGGVPIVVRYKAATPVAGGVSGGAQAQWLPPEVYAGTPEIKAFLVGTEAVTTDTTLNAQGWGTVVRTNGTITSQTTRVRLATTSSNARASISTLTSGVTTSTRVYVRWLYRVATGNQTLDNSTTATLRFFDGATGQFLAMPVSADVSKGVFFWTGSGVVSSGSQQSSQPALPNLTGTDTLMEAYLDTSTNLATVYRDGVATTASVRISNATADSLIFWAASGSTATQTSSMDLSRVMVATW